MSDTLLIIVVLAIAVGGLVAVAYLLDKRGKKSQPIGPTLPESGPIGKLLLWIARIMVALMMLSIIGAFVYRSLALASFTGCCLAIYIIDGIIYRIVRLSGK